MRLKDCFKEDFTNWLIQSNCPLVGPFKGDWWMESSRMRRQFDKIQYDSLQAILDILLIHPEADYFWYGYVEHGGSLSYTLPSSVPQPVPGDSLRVDKDIKIFLRDYKIEKLLQ